MTKLCYEVSKMNSFQHLEVLEGGKQKAEKARRAVAQLQQMMEIHEDVTREEAAIAERQRQYKEQLQKNVAIREKLQEILRRYTALVMGGDPHRRGLSSSQ